MEVTYKNKKSLNFKINDLEELSDFISKHNKTFRKITAYTKEKFSNLLRCEKIEKNILIEEIKKILEVSGKGHPPKNNLITIFGWTQIEVQQYEDYLVNRTKKYLQNNKEIDPKEFARSNSQLCKEYWIKRGYSEEEASLEIKNIQSKNSKKIKPENRVLCSKSNKEYWIKRGYSEEESEIKIKEFNDSFKLKSKKQRFT